MTQTSRLVSWCGALLALTFTTACGNGMSSAVLRADGTLKPQLASPDCRVVGVTFHHWVDDSRAGLAGLSPLAYVATAAGVDRPYAERLAIESLKTSVDTINASGRLHVQLGDSTGVYRDEMKDAELQAQLAKLNAAKPGALYFGVFFEYGFKAAFSKPAQVRSTWTLYGPDGTIRGQFQTVVSGQESLGVTPNSYNEEYMPIYVELSRQSAVQFAALLAQL